MIGEVLRNSRKPAQVHPDGSEIEDLAIGSKFWPLNPNVPLPKSTSVRRNDAKVQRFTVY